jgi:hypothetical protein
MTHVVNTKVIQSLGYLDLLLGVEEGVGELFTFTKGTLNDLETRDIAQEVGHADVVAVRVARSRRVRVLTCLDGSEAGVSIWGEGRLVRIQARYFFVQVRIPVPLAPLVCPLGSLSAPGHIL